jgi:hypothetical protein
VEPRQILKSGITASALAHLSCLLLVIFFAEVHPFGAVTAEPIAVDIVTPEEVVQKPAEPELPPTPKQKAPDSFDLSPKLDLSAKTDSAAKAATASSPPPALKPPQAASPPPPQKQAALAPPGSAPPSSAPPSSAPPNSAPPSSAPLSQAPPAAQPAPAPTSNSAPGLAQQPATQQQVTPSPVLPTFVPAPPDVSVKYHVLLGLPQDRPGDGFDAAATQKADVGTDSIAEFRRHLKTCSILPKEIAPSDKVGIKLRVLMTPEGRLAAPPSLIEASASMKGPLLMQSAISALDACQPYAMLPADRYKEWKILDLTFTPQDFINAS